MLPLAACRPVNTLEGTPQTTLAEATEGAREPIELSPPTPSAFTGDVAMRHIRFLSEELGPRPAGSDVLEQGCDYVLEALQAAGYDNARKIRYELPNGKILGNITATKAGRSDEEIVLAAHLDTVPDSPGANDDASGVAAILELAEILADVEPPRSVRFAVFKSEETLQGYDVHGFGSLQFIEGLEPEAIGKIRAACWLDKIGAGPALKVMHIEDTPAGLAKHLQTLARRRGLQPKLIAAKRWSEEMAFEDRGIPAAWIEYSPAPQLHQPEDDITNVEQEKLAAIGALVHDWILEEPAP